MKICRKNLLKCRNGITLIALVVTIIVLLILAGISISMLSGDNGILQKATDAKTKTERQSIIEQARTDVLGYQAENKGGDLEKSQLKSILDTYFKDVPSVLPNGNALLDLQLTTLDKYGTHTIKVYEFYNGNIVEGPRVKAVTLFEDKAGDEEGATEGKIHIGDYVNYNPIANGDNGTESKYKYQSLNDYTGVTEAIAASKVTSFSYPSQDFTAKATLKWQVIGIDGENILITTESPIKPDNSVTINRYYTGYCLYGLKAYINVSPNSGERNEINNISQIYKYGKGSDTSKARGMTIEDVNNLAGVIANGTTINPIGINLYEGRTGYMNYGTELIDYEKGKTGGWNPEAWIEASSTDRADSTKSPGISGKVSGYYYQVVSNEKLKTSHSAIRKNLILGESNSKKYWLSTRGFDAGNHYASFGPGYVYGNNVNSWRGTFSSSGSDTDGLALGVCPVIYLDSNISMTSAGTTDKVTTWNID